MIITECFQIDYPSWCDMSLAENQIMGFYIGPAGADTTGIRVLIANDAEQIEVYLDSRTSLLRPEPDYFGQPVAVKLASPLHRLLNQRLLRLFLGQCPGANDSVLTTALQLVFEQDSLFFNSGDEGFYFWGKEPHLKVHLEWYCSIFTDFAWVENSHWLKFLGVVRDMPAQLI